MIKIRSLSVVADNLIRFVFSDGTVKTIDFEPFIGADLLTSSLADPAYFRQVKIYDNGRGIFWPNSYDFCPDYLYGHVPAVMLAEA
jgi:hypothetical protein